MTVGWILLQVVVRLWLGVVFGLASVIFNKISNGIVKIWFKFGYCAIFAIAVVIADY